MKNVKIIRICLINRAECVRISFVEKNDFFPEGDFDFVNKKDNIITSSGKFNSPMRIFTRFFIVRGIPVGRGFHWEHLEDQAFRGCMEIIADEGRITIINEISIEQYLLSVIGSEMKSICPEEYLKVHSIVARTSAVSMARNAHPGKPYDLCADDHCQDYRGILREDKKIYDNIIQTAGEYIQFNDEIADCRFSKICGGLTVKFSDAWSEDKPHPYLIEMWDGVNKDIPELSVEKYINGDFPEAFCSPSRSTVRGFEYLRRYFRWNIKVEKEMVKNNLILKGYKINSLEKMTVVKRTDSFRVVCLKFSCGNDLVEISGELNIRKVLSNSTLPSSAFIYKDRGSFWILKGAGWGHGVGMCQTGALRMAHEGYSYREIIDFYFPRTEIKKIYNVDEIEEIKWNEVRPCYEYANCYELNNCYFGKKGNGPLNCNGSVKNSIDEQ